MTHPLVDQLRFARSEFRRGLEGITDEEARRRILPMNCVSWNVGHLAWQEQRFWLGFAQDGMIRLDVDKSFRGSAPASCPPLADVWSAWEEITAAADPWLDTVTGAIVASAAPRARRDADVTYGSLLLRTIYHYWYHTGENSAIRQQLGHSDLPVFVGALDSEAPYRSEA
ncbi:MAG: DinB family protein [Chloroflexota bacterium]|nr:DinB family protein [Chloroflexota bacterium]